MQCIRSNIFKTLFTVALFSANFAVHAEGMVPETSLLIIDEATHSGTINVKNTDSHPSLLYTNVVDLPDDQGLKLIVTQPVVRLEPGQTQQLRFILQSKQPLDVEHLKLVTFDGIPPKNDDKKIKIGINIRQDIPVLIRPATLGVVTDAWKYLKWSTVGSSVKVTNPSKYVVRLAQKVVLQPSGANATLSKTYLLPGETMTAALNKTSSGDSHVKFFPASRYGIEVPSFTSELNK
ncbi:TPA: fimbria/pilus periplasmic chaperone [Enterobacter roggenkampii]|nr:fimbria/pilus periplasmic chaperone [Enterobacter roggenkampii]